MVVARNRYATTGLIPIDQRWVLPYACASQGMELSVAVPFQGVWFPDVPPQSRNFDTGIRDQPTCDSPELF